MTILYDPQETLFRVLSRYRGTILPLVANKPTFWILQFFQLVLTLSDHHLIKSCNAEGIIDGSYEEGCRLPPLDWSVVTLPSSLLVFFVVFYGGNWCVMRATPATCNPPVIHDLLKDA